MQFNNNPEYSTVLNDFVEIYNKSVGMICREYIGNYLVIYEDNKYDVVNSLSEIKEPKRVTELYIDGLIITNKNIFQPFGMLEHIHGVPVLEITDMSNMFYGLYHLTSITGLGRWNTRNVIYI